MVIYSDGGKGGKCSAAKRWEESHKPNDPSNDKNVPSCLFTDENPATTIKGTGFKNKRIAERTIELTSQRGVRYKQYWTIRALRERAANHPYPTDGMRDAMAVFDEWLNSYKEPNEREKKEQQKEWEIFHRLCQSDANIHSYGKHPSKDELDRSRKDMSEGQHLLYELLSGGHRPNKCISFPLTSFVAIFGGPGIHGYGQHTIHLGSSTSCVDIHGIGGAEELLGTAKSKKLALVSSSMMQIQYDRRKESASLTIQQSGPTLEDFWMRKEDNAGSTSSNKRKRKEDEDANHDESNDDNEPSWACPSCTFNHIGKNKLHYLVCEVCGSRKTEHAIA